MSLNYTFGCKKDLLNFMQNFYYTGYLHSRIRLIIDNRWEIKYENVEKFENRLFSCTEEFQQKNGNSHYCIYFHKYPQHFIRKMLWKKMNKNPIIECYQI